MLNRVTIQNYQSLRDVRLTLGRFTALVGRSSSGKSAVVRALQLVAHNARGTEYITSGQSTTTVAMDLGQSTIAVRRGKGVSEYVVGTGASATETFTKCGTSVPDEVAALMRFAEVEGMDLNFSGQFDAPFLLDVPGSKVAKVLGDLTQVNLLYEASREANRRRLEVSRKAKSAEEEVTRIRASLKDYADLPEQRDRVAQIRAERDELASRVQRAQTLRTTAERATQGQRAASLIAERLDGMPDISMASLDLLQDRLDRAQVLRSHARAATVAEERRAALEALIAAAPEVSTSALLTLAQQAVRAESLRREASSAITAAEREQSLLAAADAAQVEHEQALSEITETLEAHGVCPTCNRSMA